MGADNWEVALTHLYRKTWTGRSCPPVSEAIGRVVEDTCHPVIAGRLVPLEGQGMEKEGARRGQPASFVFGGIGSQNHQGHRLQAPEDRVSNRQLAGLRSCDFD